MYQPLTLRRPYGAPKAPRLEHLRLKDQYRLDPRESYRLVQPKCLKYRTIQLLCWFFTPPLSRRHCYSLPRSHVSWQLYRHRIGILNLHVCLWFYSQQMIVPCIYGQNVRRGAKHPSTHLIITFSGSSSSQTTFVSSNSLSLGFSFTSKSKVTRSGMN